MKKFFSNLLLILFSIYPLKLLAQTETDHTNERLLTAWQKMIPRYTKIQFAGGMGLLSAGVGWNYGHNKSWETEVLWGFVPSFSNDRTKLTMTLRENYVPWSVRLNTIFDGNLWIKEPKKYPNGYYWFSTKIRTHVQLGQRISFYDKKFIRRTMSLFLRIKHL